MEELFYIQNRGYCGNCLSFWAIDGHGYTCDLDKAWKVPREQAESICRNRPKEDFMLPAVEVDRLASPHLDSEIWGR